MSEALVDPAALACHELRGPLGLVITAARFAAEEAPDDASRTRCELIVRAAERMLATAETLLASSSETDEALEFRPAERLAAIAEECLAGAFPVQLAVVAGARDASAFAAPPLFDALISSLLTNARDHGHAAHATRISVRLSGPTIALLVTNRRALHDRHRGSGLGTAIDRKSVV